MLIHWIWLSRLSGVSHSQKLELLQAFRDPEEIYKADSAAICAVIMLPEILI